MNLKTENGAKVMSLFSSQAFVTLIKIVIFPKESFFFKSFCSATISTVQISNTGC
jgi:hypothetical protein